MAIVTHTFRQEDNAKHKFIDKKESDKKAASAHLLSVISDDIKVQPP